MRARLGGFALVLAVVVVALFAAPSYGLLPVPPYSEYAARRVVLTFEPRRRAADPAHVTLRTSRTRRLLASANLTTATVSQGCHPFNIERRAKRYNVKRQVRAKTRVECDVAGSTVQIQIGDYAEPVDGASTKRSLLIKTPTRNLAFAVIGTDARLTFDGEACHRL